MVLAADTKHKIHLVGIGGSGMSGIAQMLMDMGNEVTGSDLAISEVTDLLVEHGITVFEGHAAANIDQSTDLVVISTAIPESNPEVIRARELAIPVIRRGEMLARLFNPHRGIAVAGAHGKTTTTSMMAMMFEECGLDPSYVIGGQLQETSQGARLGGGEFFIAEADESDASFLQLTPHIAVVTNVEDDHLDFYQSREKLNRAFRQFIAQIKPGGFAMVCGDDPLLMSLKSEFSYLIYYGSSAEADYHFEDWEIKGLGSSFRVFHHDKELGTVVLSIPGFHNVLNALAVLAVGNEVGIDFNAMASSLKHFKGAKRRLELLGKVNDILIFDDYAHHPTEVAATIRAVRQFHQDRLTVVFQPHRYTRTEMLAEQFGGAFHGADLLIVTSIYSAGEDPIPGVNAEIICQSAIGNGCAAIYIKDSPGITRLLTAEAEPGDVIIFMGAGDIWKTGIQTREALKAARQSA